MKTSHFLSFCAILLITFCFVACGDDEVANPSPFSIGTYEFFIWDENLGKESCVNENGLTFKKGNKFLYYSNTIYFERFEGKFRYEPGKLIIDVNKYFNKKLDKTVSVTGTITAPCMIDGDVVTIIKHEYQPVSDGHTLKIPTGTYRLRK